MPPSVQVIDIIPDLRGEDEDNDDPVMTEDEILVAHLEFASSEDATRKSRREFVKREQFHNLDANGGVANFIIDLFAGLKI